MSDQIEITPEDTARGLEEGRVQVVDVREQHEWDAGRIPGVRHIELQHLTAQAQSIDRERPVVFQCLSGVRSLMAAQAFRQAGYDAYSMAGGIAAWDAEGRPLEPAGARVVGH